MKASKLAKLFRLLSSEDLRQFKKMVHSPFFTSNKYLPKLFTLLQSGTPDFEHSKFEKQNIYKKLFAAHTYSDIKLRNLFSEMNHLIEEFLIYKKLEGNAFRKRKILLEVLNEKRVGDLFHKEEKKVRTELEKLPYRDGQFFKDCFQLNQLRMNYLDSKKLTLRKKLLHKSLNLLDQYYLLETKRIQWEFISPGMFSEFSNEERSTFKISSDNILLLIYEKLQLFHQTDDLEVFHEISNLLFSNISSIRKSLQLDFLIHLLNYAVDLMQEDDQKYNLIVLDLYKKGLEHQVLIFKNRITNTTFLNIIISSSKAKEFVWAKKFINDFRIYLSPDEVEEVETLGLAYLHFHQNQFSKSVDLLVNYAFKNPQYSLSSRVHLLRCYYEMFVEDSNFYETLISKCLAFEKWIYRAEILNPNYVKSFLSFSNFIKKLSTRQLSGKLKEQDQKEFLEILNHQNITISRSWLKAIIV